MALTRTLFLANAIEPLNRSNKIIEKFHFRFRFHVYKQINFICIDKTLEKGTIDMKTQALMYLLYYR